MFTGLVQTVGILVSRGGGALTVRPPRRFENVEIGESVAVNGCCLTVERETARGELVFHTLAESLRRTNLGILPFGSHVNLERALRVGDRLGGHFVQGHVDGMVKLLRRETMPDGDVELEFELPCELAPEVVHKGSVSLDGVSLTVAALWSASFAVRLIPQTLADTALAERPVGGKVDLETDLIGKHLRRWYELAGGAAGAGRASEALDAPERSDTGTITYEKLREAGFL